jgi:hypothetical protein
MLRSVPSALLLIAATMSGAACGPRHITLPRGPGSPVADYAAIFASATARCRDVRSLEVELALSGHAGRQKLRGRVLAGFIPGAFRLEAVSPFGSPAFILVADGSRGTLLLSRDRRVLDGAPPADILEALVGVALAPDDLRALLSGCVTPSAEPTGARAYGADWMAVALNNPSGPGGGGTVYLRRETTGGWRIAAGSFSGLDVEYGSLAAGVPAQVQIRSAATAARGDVSLTVGVNQVEVNGNRSRQELVALTIPTGMSPISLEELRESGPLGH